MTFLSHARYAADRPARRRLSLHDRVALYRQRAALRRLDDRLLDDIGLSRTEAEAEARRPIWDAPGHWHER